ncbi:MAG: PIN domain-containing protein [Polyangia bacterium]
MIFIDTGPLLARYLGRDAMHARAVEELAELESRRVRLATSNFVLDELFTLLGRRAGCAFAAERARAIYASRRLEVLRSTEKDELEAVRLMAGYADQKVSFTDCVSFALMKANRIRKALSFDRHFELAGFSSP